MKRMVATERALRDQWARDRIDALDHEYQGCTRCPKLVDTGWWTRTNIVFGEGKSNADILIVGIAPGGEEDLYGAPFVGPTGNLLDDMLIQLCPHEEIDPYRKSNRPNMQFDDWRAARAALSEVERIYYTNSVLCRPVGQDYDEHKDRMKLRNRDPSVKEYTACQDRLRRTIYYTDPFLIISLGVPALHALLSLDKGTGRTKRASVLSMSGSFVDLSIEGEVTRVRYPVLVLPHPAFLLRVWDESSPTGHVQTTLRNLYHGLHIVDLLRQDLEGIPLPERKKDGSKGPSSARR